MIIVKYFCDIIHILYEISQIYVDFRTNFWHTDCYDIKKAGG